MKVELKGVHLELTDELREFVDKKLERIDFAKDLITDLELFFIKEKDFIAEATFNFKRGVSGHIRVEEFELYKAIEELFDKMDNKIHKEKEKVQHH